MLFRSRTEQLALAERLGLRHYQSPGGGCLLTDAIFSSKLRELFDHAPADGPTLDDVALLRIGRHFRLPSGAKVILGRDRDENARLLALAAPARWCIEPTEVRAPTALVCGERTDANREAAMALILRYSRRSDAAASTSPSPTRQEAQAS